MRCFFSLSISFIIFSSLCAQAPYTQPLFTYDSLVDVVYGTDWGYAGQSDTLLLDIYKPHGDNNCKRPMIVLIHGGAWIGGSKSDVDLVRMSRDFAKRGWVVANINYRLGTHKASSYVMYALCNTNISQPCAYIADSAEVIRANYRGMQDAKGAIRFMKNRYLLDSTDIHNVYLCGESAGGFIALAAAFTDQPTEKPAACYSIANAPNPSSNLNSYSCVPSPNSLLRPDLGSIEGNLNLGNYDASVKGVGNIFGGMFDFSSLQQTSGYLPCVYLYHQGSDVVVHYQYGKILGRTSWECYAQTNLCQSYYFYPFAYGSEGIRQQFVAMGTSAPVFSTDIISNFNYLNDCFANGHSIDNYPVRYQNMVDFFANAIQQSGNSPTTSCLNSTDIKPTNSNDILQIFPNPFTDKLTVTTKSNCIFTIQDVFGKIIVNGKFAKGENVIVLNELHSGVYILTLSGQQTSFTRIVKQ
jgi:alpha/beta superfamily hydrolase